MRGWPVFSSACVTQLFLAWRVTRFCPADRASSPNKGWVRSTSCASIGWKWCNNIGKSNNHQASTHPGKHYIDNPKSTRHLRPHKYTAWATSGDFSLLDAGETVPASAACGSLATAPPSPASAPPASEPAGSTGPSADVDRTCRPAYGRAGDDVCSAPPPASSSAEDARPSPACVNAAAAARGLKSPPAISAGLPA